jgi:hypothetical protein
LLPCCSTKSDNSENAQPSRTMGLATRGIVLRLAEFSNTIKNYLHKILLPNTLVGDKYRRYDLQKKESGDIWIELDAKG